jgi:hypothetical protein
LGLDNRVEIREHRCKAQRIKNKVGIKKGSEAPFFNKYGRKNKE